MGTTIINFQIKLNEQANNDTIKSKLETIVEPKKVEKLFYHFDLSSHWLSLYLPINQSLYYVTPVVLSALFKAPSLMVACNDSESIFLWLASEEGQNIEITSDKLPDYERFINTYLWQKSFPWLKPDALYRVFSDSLLDPDDILHRLPSFFGFGLVEVTTKFKDLSNGTEDDSYIYLSAQKNTISVRKIVTKTIVKELKKEGYSLDRERSRDGSYFLRNHNETINTCIIVDITSFENDIKFIQLLYSSNSKLKPMGGVPTLHTNMVPLSEFENECIRLTKEIIDVLIPQIKKEQEVFFVTNETAQQLIKNRDEYCLEYCKVFNRLPDSLEEMSENFKTLSMMNLSREKLLLICASVYTDYLCRTNEGRLNDSVGVLKYQTSSQFIFIMRTTFSIFVGDFVECF